MIVSGCPGSGKTTLSASLASSSSQGLHLEADTFYTFPSQLIEPTEPASHQQNETIITALGRATGAFLEGGYRVFLEGIIGPWFLPRLRGELPADTAIAYVVLRVPEAVSLRRVLEREGRGLSSRVKATVRSFADLGALERHVLDAHEMSAAEVHAEVADALRAGRFRLD